MVIAKAAAPGRNPNPSKSVQENMDDYVMASGLLARQERHELQVQTGVASVDVPSTSPDWINQRSLAYEEALLSAETEYVMEQGTRIAADAITQLYQAGKQDPPPYDKNQTPGQSAELVRKILALGNAQVDAELQKMGVDPKQYADEPEPQRYTQLSKSLIDKSFEHAFADIAGLTPVQTFEGTDGKGNDEIGVVTVVSSKMKRFAQEVQRAHGEFTPDPSKAQELDKAIGDQAALLHTFGVRRMFDENGLPVIVSFAQWAPAGSGDEDPAVGGAYRQAAFSQAVSRADAQIANFLAGSADFKDNSETGKKLEKIAERMLDGYIKQNAATKDVINGMMQEMRTHADLSITGLTTAKKWSTKYPENGHPIVGVVRVWSAGGEKAIRELRDGRPGASPAATSATPPNGKPGVTSGPELMKPDDF
jgi:hypothetical protein